MMSVKDLFLGIVSLVLSRTALSYTYNKQLYEQKFTSYNIIMDNYILHTSSCVSDIFCSMWCINDQDCVSFLFDAETSNCTTFSYFVPSESGDNMEHFYVKKGWLPKVICESDVPDNTSYVNVAFGKPVILSSIWNAAYYGSLMVDGNRSPRMPCAHTLLQHNPYALIDLQQSYYVISFYLVNRGDCCSQRLHDLKILVGNDPNNLSVCIDYPTTIGRSCTFRVSTLCQGRYIKLQLFTREYLHICEVEVYGTL